MQEKHLELNFPFKKQQGSVLVISLIFLLVMTFLGIYVYRSSVLQLQMADNAGSKTSAFQQAESARAYAEGLLNAKADSMSTGTNFQCSAAGYFARTDLAIQGCASLALSQMQWNDTDSFAVPNSTDQRYAIEYMGEDEVLEPYGGVLVGVGTGKSETINVYVFRIYAKGSETAGAKSILQSIFLARKSS